MIKHISHSTPIDRNGQQLCFADNSQWSNVGGMNMGKRLKQEMNDRGMSPTDLCEAIPALALGTLSAIYTRDSKYSEYAPAIADALGVELRWLLTGDLPKHKPSADVFSKYKMTKRETNIQEMDSDCSIAWLTVIAVIAVAKFGSYFDDNKEAVYGDQFHLPVNCRAYVQASIDGFRAGIYTADSVMNGLERNCGINGQSWKNNR